MKCICKDSEIKRVSDEEAYELVRNGWKFVAKKVWKEKVHGGKKEKPVPKTDKVEAPKNKYRQKKLQKGPEKAKEEPKEQKK